MTEIIPGLWIGDREDALNAKWLKQHKISVIVNCTKSLPYIQEGHSLSHIVRVAVNDNLEPIEIDRMSKYLGPVIEKIWNWLPEHNILVHCYAGRQRSAAVILAYLIKYGDIELDKAIELLRTKKIDICTPQCNFYESLLQPF
jgi:protein-tyrosine phosphatase